MIDAVVDDRAVVSLHVNMIKTGDIDPVFIRVTAPEMMGIDPAGFAEIMTGCTCIPRVTAKVILTGDHVEFILWHRRHDRPPAAAERAVAPSALREVRISRNSKHDLSAMA